MHYHLKKDESSKQSIVDPEGDVAILHYETIRSGEAVGRVGTTKENGFWFPHIHFQFISEKEMKRKEKPFTLDGYGSPKDLDYLRENYPNPLVVLPMGRKE